MVFFNIGINDPRNLRPHHIYRRMAGGTNACSYADIFPPLQPGVLLHGDASDHPTNIQQMWDLGQMILKENPKHHDIHTGYHL